MTIYREILWLLRKDIKLELRSHYGLSGMVLYMLLLIFILYLSFVKVDGPTWITLLWLVVLFTSVTPAARSFLQESRQRDLYYYSIARPVSILLGKMIFSWLELILLTVAGTTLYILVLGFPPLHTTLFILSLFLGVTGLAFLFTLVSAIVSRTGNPAALMAVLGFPLIIPLLIITLSLSGSSLEDNWPPGAWPDLLTLVAVDVIIIVLGVILFPYIWRD